MPLSGKYGTVNGHDAVSNWTINDEQTLAVAIDSSTDGATNRKPSVESWSGTFAQNLYEPSVLPGEMFTFNGFTAPDDGDPAGNGVIYSGDALLSQCVINWDWAGGAILTLENTFLGHLALAIVSGNNQDISISNPVSICGTKIEFSADGTTWTELPNISTANVTLSVATNDYVNSSTGCWTGRAAGPKDWTAAIVLDDTDRSTVVPDKGELLQWRFYVTDALFWEFKWGRVRDFTGITVDRVSGAIIQQTMNVDMAVSDGSALGHVLTPGGTYWQGKSALITGQPATNN